MAAATFVSVLTMLLYSVPGYILVKTKLVKTSSISAFAVLLMYVCQPCLCVYAFDGVTFTKDFVVDMLVFMGLMLAVLCIMLAAAYLLLRKKQEQAKYRIAAIAAGFGNFTFMGIPLIETVLPDFPEAKVYATLAFLAMSFLSWTVGSAIIAHDPKYVKLKNVILNPGTISFVAALLISAFGITLPETLASAITLVGRMATPICMTVMGMRLASMKFLSLFNKPTVYLSVAVKQLVMPLAGLLMVYFLPISDGMKITFYIMCCTPVASNVLNFAELIGDGTEEAANTVLFGTLLSVLTIPLMMLLAP